MNYLLDTHVFLWSILTSKQISSAAKKILTDPELPKYVSVISFWEIALKFSLGRIDLADIEPEELPNVAKQANFEILDLDKKTAASFYKLPQTHNKDPFDRMLAWQAISKGYCLITKDTGFEGYTGQGLKTVW